MCVLQASKRITFPMHVHSPRVHRVRVLQVSTQRRAHREGSLRVERRAALASLDVSK